MYALSAYLRVRHAGKVHATLLRLVPHRPYSDRMNTNSHSPTGQQVSIELGAHIHQAMWSRRISQKQLADVLGIAQTGISTRLRGKVPFSVPELVVVAQALGLSPAELLARATGEALPSFTAASAVATHAVNGPTQYLEGTIEAHNARKGPAEAGPSHLLPRLDSNQQPFG